MMGLVHCKDCQLTHNQAPEVPCKILYSVQLFRDADAKGFPFPIVLHMPALMFFSFLTLAFDAYNLNILMTQVLNLCNHYSQVRP